MKKTMWALLAALSLICITACQKDDGTEKKPNASEQTSNQTSGEIELPEDIF